MLVPIPKTTKSQDRRLTPLCRRSLAYGVGGLSAGGHPRPDRIRRSTDAGTPVLLRSEWLTMHQSGTGDIHPRVRHITEE